MNIFLPYTKLQDATLICLLRYSDLHFTKLGEREDAYPDYFKQRWAEGNSFINIEHDVVFWDGALEALWGCPHDWCAFAYQQTDYMDCCYPFGLVKFTDRLIARLPHAWSDIRPECNNWSSCDSYFAEYANAHQVYCHPHFPPIVNANPGRVPNQEFING